MRTVPPPIRDLELREALSELLKRALRAPDRAEPLHLLRSFERAIRAQQHPEEPAALTRVGAYCRALEALSRHQVRSADPVEQALQEAACLFNEGLFFEAHEVLEAVWLRQEEPARPFLQGLIQIAVGFHHLENNNLRGCLFLLKEGVEKVRGCGPNRFGLDLDRFIAQIESARRSIESLEEEAFDRFDRHMVPQMSLAGVNCWT